MKRAAFPLAILAALVTGFAARELVSTAQAQSPKTASCISFDSVKLLKTGGTEPWMNEQLAAGRTDLNTVGDLLCAW